jgi:hypothetical protein
MFCDWEIAIGLEDGRRLGLLLQPEEEFKE